MSKEIENVSTREEVLGKAKDLDCDTVHKQIQFLQGKVLTLLEASISDKVQLKALKDIVKNDFSNQMQYVNQLCYPEISMLTTDQAESILPDILPTK